MTALLEAEGVRKSFGRGPLLGSKRLRAVDGVDLTVARGEVLALVGESGCGKTTTAKMILRSAAPDSGEIIYNDRGTSRDVLQLQGPELFAYRRDRKSVV